jgi:hypothetical protein
MVRSTHKQRYGEELPFLLTTTQEIIEKLSKPHCDVASEKKVEKLVTTPSSYSNMKIVWE